MTNLKCANPGCDGDVETIYGGYALCGNCVECVYEIQGRDYRMVDPTLGEPDWFTVLSQVELLGEEGEFKDEDLHGLLGHLEKAGVIEHPARSGETERGDRIAAYMDAMVKRGRD